MSKNCGVFLYQNPTLFIYNKMKFAQWVILLLGAYIQIQSNKILHFKVTNRPVPSCKTLVLFQIKSSGPNILFTAKIYQTPENNFTLMAILNKTFGDMPPVPGCILLFLIITGQTSVMFDVDLRDFQHQQ